MGVRMDLCFVGFIFVCSTFFRIFGKAMFGYQYCGRPKLWHFYNRLYKELCKKVQFFTLDKDIHKVDPVSQIFQSSQSFRLGLTSLKITTRNIGVATLRMLTGSLRELCGARGGLPVVGHVYGEPRAKRKSRRVTLCDSWSVGAQQVPLGIPILTLGGRGQRPRSEVEQADLLRHWWYWCWAADALRCKSLGVWLWSPAHPGVDPQSCDYVGLWLWQGTIFLGKLWLPCNKETHPGHQECGCPGLDYPEEWGRSLSFGG